MEYTKGIKNTILGYGLALSMLVAPMLGYITPAKAAENGSIKVENQTREIEDKEEKVLQGIVGLMSNAKYRTFVTNAQGARIPHYLGLKLTDFAKMKKKILRSRNFEYDGEEINVSCLEDDKKTNAPGMFSYTFEIGEDFQDDLYTEMGLLIKTMGYGTSGSSASTSTPGPDKKGSFWDNLSDGEKIGVGVLGAWGIYKIFFDKDNDPGTTTPATVPDFGSDSGKGDGDLKYPF